MEIFDNYKAVLLSLMTLPPKEGEKDWLIVLRLKVEEIGPIVKELTSSGFNVTYVG
ncbi:MAG: hypothetical protein JXA79_10780 [Deltaproteobacteria bacterium]|nr:hypothetical protein [Deltaproteobacteria bacterium]